MRSQAGAWERGKSTLAVTAGNRDRKGSSPDYNAVYLLKLPK
jgi:hypothetical protein